MNIHDLMEMTAPELDALPRERSCLVLTVSPVEEHGPHLPLGTDIYEAAGMVERLAERLGERFADWHLLRYPAIPLGSDTFEYVGSAEVSPDTLRAVLRDVIASFARHGFDRCLIASHHGGNAHNLVLDDLTREFDKSGQASVLSLAGKIVLDLYMEGRLAEFYERWPVDPADQSTLDLDCHAGAFETSEMLALEPGLVRDVYQRLESVVVPLELLNRESGRREADGQGYFGAPKLASAEMGEAYMDFVVDLIEPDVVRFLEDRQSWTIPLKWRAGMKALGVVNAVRTRVARLARAVEP